MIQTEKASLLSLHLHGVLVGYLSGSTHGNNIITFAPDYLQAESRPTFTLTQLDKPDILKKPWHTRQRLHPVLSNLLPEGALRTWTATQLGIHPDNEFPLIAWLGHDLPGALIVTPVDPEHMPDWTLPQHRSIRPTLIATSPPEPRFSLAGVQMKFSGKQQDGRYQIKQSKELGDWIIKTPSTLYPGVPANEYTCMTLASLAGVDLPDIRLVSLSDLDGLPPIRLPAETQAYAIRRFDRGENNARTHTEDFAQILQKYPHDKYQSSNYEALGRILLEHSDTSAYELPQLARRLLVNILLGNGDAHLKNWTVSYPNQQTPRLAPAYDILYTQAYITGESQIALKLGGEKDWYKLNRQHFQQWARKAGANWPDIENALDDTLQRAGDLWPTALIDLPMLQPHKNALQTHWRHLHQDWSFHNR